MTLVDPKILGPFSFLLSDSKKKKKKKATLLSLLNARADDASPHASRCLPHVGAAAPQPRRTHPDTLIRGPVWRPGMAPFLRQSQSGLFPEVGETHSTIRV